MEIGGVNALVLFAVLAALLVFGLVYNEFVAWLERSKRDRGYTAFLVVGGTLVTLGGAVFLIGLLPVGLVLACFAASGLPMVIGSASRNAAERRNDEEKAALVAKELLRNAEEKDRWIRMAAGDYQSSECE